MAAAAAVGRINAIALDGSVNSEHAFQWYIKNYHAPNDTVLIIHLQQLPQVPAMGLLAGEMVITEEYRTIIHDCIANTKVILEKYRKICNDEKIKHKVVLDDSYKSPGFMICELAKKHHANVIITGQRGLSAINRVFLGSTSDYVLHHSHVPVIVVPHASQNSSQIAEKK